MQASYVRPGVPVAVLQEPTHQWVSSILAIMWLGAVYVPLDLSLPWARLAAMVKDCRSGVVLVDESTRHDVHKLEAPGITVVDVSVLGRQESASPIVSSATADSIAAILYTSGSTGIPKGIMLSHRGLCNWAEHVPRLYGLGSEVVLQQTSSTFDLSLIQILTALCHGGKPILVPRQLRGDASSIGDIMAEHNVTFTCATPSEYSCWLDYGRQGLLRCKAWRTAFCAGESIPGCLPWKLSSLQKEGLRLYNLYGPTEASLAATGMEIPCSSSAPLAEFSSSGPIPAGRPLPNYSIYVVDPQLRPVPAGVQGEIYIGGPGVGLGYLERPDLTAERFVADLFTRPAEHARGFSTLHRTGDLGRWRADGALVVEGRVGGDTQVKVRGLRIDLVEIENAMMIAAEGALCEVVVSTCRPDSVAQSVLVAYVVFHQAYTSDEINGRISRIRSRLGDLPQYMHPSIIVPVRSLPKTNSAKLDRKAVAELALPNGTIVTHQEGSAVLKETEAALKRIWEDVVSGQGVASSSQITPETDFFQVGGSSLLLLSLRARITDMFNVKIPLIRMFDNSTLATMARLIEQGGEQSIRCQSSMITKTDGPIDWDDETKLPSSLSGLPVVKPVTYMSSPKVVVLTGATGHLGRALLDALVTHPSVQKVHCIGVRNAGSRKSIRGGHKVHFHEGDLILPSLGLADDQAERIFGEASMIIHNGADMSYLKTYASLRPCNLQSTKELVRMSARRPVPFHFISTVSVGHLVAESMTAPASADDGQRQNDCQQHAEEFVFGPVSAAAYRPAQRLSAADGSEGPAHGYIASKWASECFLERLNERYPAWPVWIHRPSLITRGDTGAGSKPGLELVQNMRHYSTLMRAVPVIAATRLKGAFDIVELDTVVDGIMRAALDEENTASDTAGVRFLHHVGGVELPLKDLHMWAPTKEEAEQKDEDIRVEVEEIDLAEWARRAEALGMHETLVAMLDDLASTQAGIAVPRVTK